MRVLDVKTQRNPDTRLCIGVLGRIRRHPTFALVGTIIGPVGLTAVFGKGTGVSPRVWSPERNGRANDRGRRIRPSVSIR